jgi:uncharacterized protein YndB with AHSA1/START domain
MDKLPVTIELNLDRTIEATPAEVYEAWLNPAHPASPWFGVTKAVVNPPKIDGLFYSMYMHEGKEHASYGRFIALEKPGEIRYSLVSEMTRGLESLVTLTFEAQDRKTLLRVKHVNLPDDAGGRRYQQAWGFVLGRMAAHFVKSGGSK